MRSSATMRDLCNCVGMTTVQQVCAVYLPYYYYYVFLDPNQLATRAQTAPRLASGAGTARTTSAVRSTARMAGFFLRPPKMPPANKSPPGLQKPAPWKGPPPEERAAMEQALNEGTAVQQAVSAALDLEELSL